MVAGALWPEQIAQLVDAVRQLRVANRAVEARLDGGSGNASTRAEKRREFCGAQNEFSGWSFNVEFHLSLVVVGFVGALEWAEGNVDEVTPEKVRAKTVKNANNKEKLDRTLFRAVGAKVKGGALDIAKGVARDREFELWRRLVRVCDPRTSGQGVTLLNDIIRAKGLQTSRPLQGVDKWSELVRKYKNASGKTLSDSVKMTALRNTCPKEVGTHLQLDARRLMCAQHVKEQVLAHVNAQQANENAGELMEGDGAQGKRAHAKQEWAADDVGAARQ